jgi:hypothetical protein
VRTDEAKLESRQASADIQAQHPGACRWPNQDPGTFGRNRCHQRVQLFANRGLRAKGANAIWGTRSLAALPQSYTTTSYPMLTTHPAPCAISSSVGNQSIN